MHAYLVYDADCRLCTFVKDVAVALDWRRRIRPVALQDPSSSDLLAAVHESERDTSFHFVKGDEATSCGAGLLEVLGVLPMGAGIPKLEADAPHLRAASERAYALLHGLRDAMDCAT